MKREVIRIYLRKEGGEFESLGRKFVCGECSLGQ